MSDPIRLNDVEVKRDDTGDGVFVSCRGGTRFVTYEELVELADSEGPVTIR